MDACIALVLGIFSADNPIRHRLLEYKSVPRAMCDQQVSRECLVAWLMHSAGQEKVGDEPPFWG